MTEKQITGISDLLRTLTIPLLVILLGYFSTNLVTLNGQVTQLTVRLSVLENTLQLYLNAIQRNNHPQGTTNTQ